MTNCSSRRRWPSLVLATTLGVLTAATTRVHADVPPGPHVRNVSFDFTRERLTREACERRIAEIKRIYAGDDD